LYRHETNYMDYLKILFQPKSILGLLVAVGLLFLLLSGLSMSLNKETSDFFLNWGKILLLIGIAGWLLYLLPSIIRNWGKMLGR